LPRTLLTRSKDANNIITRFFYDARSRLPKVRDGLSRSTLLAYAAAGRFNKVMQPDNMRKEANSEN
jgi:YD repeat-containing protein